MSRNKNKNFKEGMAPVMETEEDIAVLGLEPVLGRDVLFSDASSLGLKVPPPLSEDDLPTDGAVGFDGTAESVADLIAAGFQVKQSEACEVDIYLDGELKGVAMAGDYVNLDGTIVRLNKAGA